MQEWKDFKRASWNALFEIIVAQVEVKNLKPFCDPIF